MPAHLCFPSVLFPKTVQFQDFTHIPEAPGFTLANCLEVCVMGGHTYYGSIQEITIVSSWPRILPGPRAE